MVAPYGFNDQMANFIEFATARLLAKNNWQVFALTRRGGQKHFTDEICGVEIYRYQNLAQGIFFLLKILFISRPAIIHVHNQRNNRMGIITAILAKFTFTPLLFTEYGLLHDHYLTSDRDDPLSRTLKLNGLIFSLKQIVIKSYGRPAALFASIKNYFFHWALTHADKIVFVSRHNLPLAKSLGLKNCMLLPYILDDARWGEEIEIRQKEGSATEEKIKKITGSRFCLFVGQIKRRKGWDVYLKSMPLIDKNIMPYFALVTSSSDQTTEDVLGLAEKLSVNDRLIYFRKIDGRSLKALYDHCSMVIVPSRYEGYGLVAVEAFQAKKPVIASAVEALTQTVQDGFNGLLVPPNDPEKLAQAICQLATNHKLAEKLIAGGQAALTKLKSAELKNQWLDFYEKLIIGQAE